MAGPPSLDDFDDDGRSTPGVPAYIDTEVAEEHREQLLTSKVGHSTAARWLRSLGYSKANQAKVREYRVKNGWTPE